MEQKAKKSLGQNFLKSNLVLHAIVSAGALTSADTVLEIGPGRGALTRELLKTGARVVAIEKDRELIPELQEIFASETKNGQLKLMYGDILLWNPSEHGLARGTYKLIANIPYYITGAILEKFLAGANQPERMVVLVQKEVAQRIKAQDSKESILSISVKAFGVPKIVLRVSKKSFHPAPKVDSAVLSITNISQKYFSGWDIPEDEAIHHFFTIVRAGFAHKRKLLARNLEAIAPLSFIYETLEKSGIPPKARPENLTVEEWVHIAQLSTRNTKRKS